MLSLLAALALSDSRGMALLKLIDEKYWNGSTGTYVAHIDASGARSRDAAFAWDMGVLLSAKAAAIGVIKDALADFERADKAMSKYWSHAHGIRGYSVWPGQKDPDRYYDDNAWIGLAQIEAFERSHDRRYLKEAEETFAFLISGWDDRLGGGIYWREKERKSKNTCVNAPASLLAARLYQATKQPDYLLRSEALYRWTAGLRDRDGLYWDSKALNGSVDKTKWSYNSALMIRSALVLYRITNKHVYLNDALGSGKSSVNHWVDSVSGAIKDEGPFAHHLAEAFLQLAEMDHTMDWNKLTSRAVDAAFTSAGGDRLYGLRWDRYEVRDGKRMLLYQASMARALLMLERSRR